MSLSQSELSWAISCNNLQNIYLDADLCTLFVHYLYSTLCSWMIMVDAQWSDTCSAHDSGCLSTYSCHANTLQTLCQYFTSASTLTLSFQIRPYSESERKRSCPCIFLFSISSNIMESWVIGNITQLVGKGLYLLSWQVGVQEGNIY